jgi:dipeptidyl aminopeptidase/acylaminoacyl peptidase
MTVTRRMILAGFAAGALSRNAIAASTFTTPDMPPLDSRDYADARKSFSTHLLKRGPAPEVAGPLNTPHDAKRVTYPGGPDGSIELIAWHSNYEPSQKLKPAVLFLHGGNATGDGHWELIEAYWQAGFVVMLPSFRGENGQAGNYSGFYDETSDALAAASYLENMPGIDRNRFFIAGHSNGGTLALLAAMTRKFRAAVPISAGVSAWRYFGRYSDEVRFDPENQEEFIMRSSVCFGKSLKCPTLLLRGSEERPFDEDHHLLMERVRSAGVSIDKKVMPGTHSGVVLGAVAESIRFFNQFT